MKRPDNSAKGADAQEPALSQSLSLGDLSRALWRSRGFTLLSVIVCVFFAVVHLMTSTPVYPTEMLLAPQQATNGQGSNLSSGISSAASLLGIRTDTANSDFEKFRVLYISTQTAEIINRRLNLLQRSFPGWNQNEGRWEMPPLSLSNAPQRFVRWIFGRTVWRAPAADDLAVALSTQITVTKREDDPFLMVSSRSSDPEFTEKLMVELASAANDILRARAQQQAAVQIRYLNNQLQTVSNSEHRQVLTTLLLGQEQNLMLSHSNIPYAAQILSPPTTHYNQAKPGVTLTLAIGFVVGLMIGIFISFFREASAWSRNEQSRDSMDILRGLAGRRSR